MDTLTLAATLLETLASATPALSSGQSALSSILEPVLETTAALIRAGENGALELQALTAHVQLMAARGTDPTEDDWNSLKARSDAAHALIQNGSSASTAAPTASSP